MIHDARFAGKSKRDATRSFILVVELVGRPRPRPPPKSLELYAHFLHKKLLPRNSLITAEYFRVE